MNEDLTSFDYCIFDESVGQSVKFLDILFCTTVKVKIQILKVFRSFCVLSACNV